MGGSGGGASGTVSYPTYMVEFHGRILDHQGTDSPENSFIDAFNLAYGSSPFAGAVAYDPSLHVASAIAGITAFSSAITALSHTGDFTTALAVAKASFFAGTTPIDTAPLYTTPIDTATLYTTTLDTIAVSDSDIADDVAAMDTILTDQLEQEELPRFRAGMLNINAIHSSAYIIGEALLRASKDKALLKYGTDLQLSIANQVREINARHALSYREITSRLQLAKSEQDARHLVSNREITSRLQLAKSDLDAKHLVSKREIDAKFYIHHEELVRIATMAMLADLMKKMDLTYQYTHLNADSRRFAIVSGKEQVEEQLAIAESDAKWDIDLFRVAGIILAAPSGGVAQGTEKKSKAVSAIGGAISGAATGAVAGAAVGGIGAPVGAAIGAVAGVGLAMLS